MKVQVYCKLKSNFCGKHDYEKLEKLRGQNFGAGCPFDTRCPQKVGQGVNFMACILVP
jgi:hypothetical protein